MSTHLPWDANPEEVNFEEIEKNRMAEAAEKLDTMSAEHIKDYLPNVANHETQAVIDELTTRLVTILPSPPAAENAPEQQTEVDTPVVPTV